MKADTKNWYESKSVWAGVGLIVLGLLRAFDIIQEGAYVQCMEAVLVGLGILGIRTGKKPLS